MGGRSLERVHLAPPGWILLIFSLHKRNTSHYAFYCHVDFMLICASACLAACAIPAAQLMHGRAHTSPFVFLTVKRPNQEVGHCTPPLHWRHCPACGSHPDSLCRACRCFLHTINYVSCQFICDSLFRTENQWKNRHVFFLRKWRSLSQSSR